VVQERIRSNYGTEYNNYMSAGGNMRFFYERCFFYFHICFWCWLEMFNILL